MNTEDQRLSNPTMMMNIILVHNTMRRESPSQPSQIDSSGSDLPLDINPFPQFF
jgi:hypothetical protein